MCGTIHPIILSASLFDLYLADFTVCNVWEALSPIAAVALVLSGKREAEDSTFGGEEH